MPCRQRQSLEATTKPQGLSCQSRRRSSEARPRFEKRCPSPGYEESEKRSKKQSTRKRGQAYCQRKSLVSFQHPCPLAKRRTRRSRSRTRRRITGYKRFGDSLYIRNNGRVSTNFDEANLRNTYLLIYLFGSYLKSRPFFFSCVEHR